MEAEFLDHRNVLDSITSVSELEDYGDDLKNLARRGDVSVFTLKITLSAVEDRRLTLSDEYE